MANDRCLYSSILCSVVVMLLGLSSMVVSTKDLQRWNILSPKRDRSKYSLKNYCESWRMNVELNNLRDFNVVPGECIFYISKYMTSTQYNVDQERAVEEALVHLTALQLAGDGKDAWIFDVDDTLLSTLPFFKQHSYGGEPIEKDALESWMEQMKAPAVEAVLPLYNQLKMSGVKIIIITWRSERLRDVTAQNLVQVGFTGWTQLIMRGDSDNGKSVTSYKSAKREALVKDGYRILGNVGDQWSDVLGTKAGIRTFKLPNSMYYSA
ncbi:hypothetical protein SUGI_0650000 [Cryptomeria japonica]|uniref:acid phosphatase 1 isoform X2 n=1 Tax=Cryptomeria japonica TaxID=3369 RepID=UPI0024148E0C|nr:acid phosphatase 1 isoform X2 [Cryptomeria japonica]GLJ32302.1 hypothetical protein SUGI_0650000 [Cryptomeria japonica]